MDRQKEMNIKYGERSYNGKQWQEIHRWIRKHAKLIGEQGVQKAAVVAFRSHNDFPEIFIAEGWTPLPRLSPTEGQIEGVIRNFKIDLGKEEGKEE